jgi:hypothetical protein
LRTDSNRSTNVDSSAHAQSIAADASNRGVQEQSSRNLIVDQAMPPNNQCSARFKQTALSRTFESCCNIPDSVRVSVGQLPCGKESMDHIAQLQQDSFSPTKKG